MARKPTGLQIRNGVWYIDKIYRGQRLSGSTGTSSLREAEACLAQQLTELRRRIEQPQRPSHTFTVAATRYLNEHASQKSIGRAAIALGWIQPVIGHLPIEQIHMGTLEGYFSGRLRTVTPGTVNREITVIRRILSLAATRWRNADGTPWLTSPAQIANIPDHPRPPRPITWPEQARLFQALPGYLATMALFAVNTGLRDQELCGLRWDWERPLSSVFILPATVTKNGRERIVPLNAIARRIIDSARRTHTEYAFTYEGHRLDRMNNRAWKKARLQAGLPEVRVHDLRHTFGMRLRAAGVSFEDRQDLLGHHAGRITTHYSRAEIARLIECVERLCDDSNRPELALVSA
jgi:integrase